MNPPTNRSYITTVTEKHLSVNKNKHINEKNRKIKMAFITASVAKWQPVLQTAQACIRVRWDNNMFLCCPMIQNTNAAFSSATALTTPLLLSERRWNAAVTEGKAPSLHGRQHSNSDILNNNESIYQSVHPQYNHNRGNYPYTRTLPERLTGTEPVTIFTALYITTAFITVSSAAYHGPRS